MAIQLALTTPDGVNHPQAYVRVVYVQLDYENNQATLVLQVHHDQSTRKAGLAPVRIHTLAFGDNPDSKLSDGTILKGTLFFSNDYSDAILLMSTPIKSSYGYVKKLSEYQGAVDV